MYPIDAFRVLAACALLSAPPDAPVPEFHPAMLAPLRSAALSLELLDERETHLLMAEPLRWPGDVETLRCRWRELRTAPTLSECKRFPAQKVVEGMLEINRAYRAGLESRLGYDTVHAEEIRAAMIEAANLSHAWELASLAAAEGNYGYVRRQALLDMRTLIGCRAFYRGDLPAALPYWRIQPAP